MSFARRYGHADLESRSSPPLARRDRGRGNARIHVRHRQKTLGLLPHPAPRRHRLRRLHRAAHLPALPQDGRRDAASTIPKGCDWDSLKEQVRHRHSPTTTPTSCANCARQRASSATSSPSPCPASTTPSTSSALIAMIDEEEWSAMDVDVKGAAFEGLLEKAASEGKKGRGPVLHAPGADPVHRPRHEARPARQAATSRSATRPAAPAAFSCAPTNG